MKLKEGMHCYHKAFRWKGIGKIVKIDGDCTNVRFNHELMVCPKNNTVASYNAIDLIQVGDYVNGEYVWRETNNSLMIGDVDNGCPLNEIKIETIVTKEMFSSVEYRVEE